MRGCVFRLGPALRADCWAFVLGIFLIACGGGGSSGKPAMVADPPSTDASSDDESTFSTFQDGGAGPGGNDEAQASQASDEGAQTLLKQFVAPHANYAALTRALRPTTNDYQAMFDAATADKIEA